MVEVASMVLVTSTVDVIVVAMVVSVVRVKVTV